jgi:phosphoserine phosphatase
MAVAFAGWNRNELLTVVGTALREAGVSQRLFEPLRAVFDWARKTGTGTFLISASPDFVVEIAGQHWGFVPEAIAACTPYLHAELLQGSLGYELPYAMDKVRAARARLGARRWLASFGDSGFDLAMLKEAQIGVAVRPKPSLAKLLSENPSLWLFQEQE